MSTQLELLTGREIDIDGHVDARGIQYVGVAREQVNGSWRCLANVCGAQCLVEVQIKRAVLSTGER